MFSTPCFNCWEIVQQLLKEQQMNGTVFFLEMLHIFLKDSLNSSSALELLSTEE
jgi:hypothetical protein